MMGQLCRYKNCHVPRSHSRYGIQESQKMLMDGLNDSCSSVIAMALSGLRHTPLLDALPTMLAHLNHPDLRCRRQLAFALCSYEIEGKYANQLTDAFLKLAADEYEETRDWATCALQHSDLDTPEIRERLWINAHDDDQYVADEALQGLAKRKNSRAVKRILHYINNGGYCHDKALLEVIEQYGDPHLLKRVQEYIEQKSSLN